MPYADPLCQHRGGCYGSGLRGPTRGCTGADLVCAPLWSPGAAVRVLGLHESYWAFHILPEHLPLPVQPRLCPGLQLLAQPLDRRPHCQWDPGAHKGPAERLWSPGHLTRWVPPSPPILTWAPVITSCFSCLVMELESQPRSSGFCDAQTKGSPDGQSLSHERPPDVSKG